MSQATTFAQVQDEKGATRLAIGAWFGLFAGIIAIVLPVTIVFLSAYDTGGFFSLGTALVQTSGLLIIAGAFLFILSLFLYRRGFAALRKVDPEFGLASFLCILGTLGFILILISAAVLTGTSSSLLQCVKGDPSHALSCLESSQPLGAYTGIVGFALAWVGGLGIAFGLWLAGGRFDEPPLTVGAVVYLVFLIAVISPLLALAFSAPELGLLLLVLPVLTLAAPALVLVGTLPQARRRPRGA